jgi:hypothetical protein
MIITPDMPQSYYTRVFKYSKEITDVTAEVDSFGTYAIIYLKDKDGNFILTGDGNSVKRKTIPNVQVVMRRELI